MAQTDGQTDKQTNRQTDRHGNSLTNSTQRGRVGENTNRNIDMFKYAGLFLPLLHGFSSMKIINRPGVARAVL